jgi:fungal nitric oxide reductase
LGVRVDKQHSNLLPYGVITLTQNTSQLEELKRDPSVVPNFVRELCRYHTGSALAMKRVVKVDIELGGKVRRY